MSAFSQSDDVGLLLRSATARLRSAGVDSPRVDAELLLAHACGVSRGEITHAAVLGRTLNALLSSDDATGSETVPESTFAEFVVRRCAREPLQHILGVAPFRHLELEVGPGVFVPRPETESVAEQAIAEADAVAAVRGDVVVVDLCTGSGAIALAVASEVPAARVYAVELDAAAFGWAERNLLRVRSASPVSRQPQLTLHRGDARRALPELNATCDVVVSNPPYVPPAAIPRDAEVALHDPQVALYGLGADGLEVPRGIALAAVRLLRPGGFFVMEHAEVQAQQTRQILTATGAFDDVRTVDDLTGRPRMVVGRRTAGEPRNMGDSKA